MAFARTLDHAKAEAYLAKFLYYEGRTEEAERVFATALRHNEELQEPAVPVLAAYLYASRGERQRIDPMVFALRTDESFDGDQAYWLAGVFALLGEQDPALAWLRRAVELGKPQLPVVQP